jgi:hypothetical protein
MTEQEALRYILNNSCSNPAYHPDDGKTHTYKIGLCCEEIKVTAIPSGKWPDIEYEIVSVEGTRDL